MFDPFNDFATAGYLRNVESEKNPAIVKRVEHALFTAKRSVAMAYLQKCRDISYRDFLEVHRILFDGFYPWAGRDRMDTAPNLAISKGDILFAHPAAARLAVEHGLRLGMNKQAMRQSPGEVMGLFAYGHPFLDGNGRTMLLVHSVLSNRAGFSIDWHKTRKSDYLLALSAEIQKPGKGILDGYLKTFMAAPQSAEVWGTIIQSINGLDGGDVPDQVEGVFSDPLLAEKYREFERQREYQIVSPRRTVD